MKSVTPATNHCISQREKTHWTKVHPLLFFFLTDALYFVTHELPTASYRHCARSTDEVHRPTDSCTTGLDVQWGCTLTGAAHSSSCISPWIVSYQLHNSTQYGWKKICRFHSYLLICLITNNFSQFRAFLKWKIMTQSCPCPLLRHRTVGVLNTNTCTHTSRDGRFAKFLLYN